MLFLFTCVVYNPSTPKRNHQTDSINVYKYVDQSNQELAQQDEGLTAAVPDFFLQVWSALHQRQSSHQSHFDSQVQIDRWLYVSSLKTDQKVVYRISNLTLYLIRLATFFKSYRVKRWYSCKPNILSVLNIILGTFSVDLFRNFIQYIIYFLD